MNKDVEGLNNIEENIEAIILKDWFFFIESKGIYSKGLVFEGIIIIVERMVKVVCDDTHFVIPCE